MKDLSILIKIICKNLNLPFGREDAIAKNAKNFLDLDYNNVYKGYKLITVEVATGGEYIICNKVRKSKKEMQLLLNGIILGIELAKTANKEYSI